MLTFKNSQNKTALLLLITSVISMLISLFFSEDSLGGARHDYLYHEKYFFLFSNNFYETFMNYGLDISVRNSPIFYMLFGFFLKLGFGIKTLKFINFLILVPLSIFFVKCLNVKYPLINKETKIIFLSVLFLSPTIRSLISWPYPFLWGLTFFIISLYFFLKFQKESSYIKKIRYTYLNIIFLSLSAYFTPNFAIFSGYFMWSFFCYIKFKKEIYYLICLSFLLSFPAIYFVISHDFYLFKSEVFEIENSVKYNLSNKIIIISSIILIFFLPFIKINKAFNLKNCFFILIKNKFILIFIIINILFFNFLKNAGGGIFYHLSILLFDNSLILFFTFIVAVYIFEFFNLYNYNNVLLFLILIIYNLQFTIYYKYFDPLILFLLLFLVSFKYDIKSKLNIIAKKYYIFYTIFLLINLSKGLINY